MDLPPGTLLPFQLELASQRILKPVIREESLAQIRRRLALLQISAVIFFAAFLVGDMLSSAPVMVVSTAALVAIIVATVLTMWRAKPSNWPARLDEFRHFDLRAAERGLAAIFATDHKAVDVMGLNGAFVTVLRADRRDDDSITADLSFCVWDIYGNPCPEWQVSVDVIRADELPSDNKLFRLETEALQRPPYQPQVSVNVLAKFARVRSLSHHEKLLLIARATAIVLPEERASVRRM